MAKYCIKCGKALPDGVEVCPDCNISAQESDAALFTKMASNAEVWKTSEPVKQKKKKGHAAGYTKKTLAYYSCAGLLVVIAVFLILFFQPSGRVVRAIRDGNYERALEIYYGSNKLKNGDRVEKIDRAIMAAADQICTQFANHEVDAATAANDLRTLGGLGQGAADMLAETYEEFRTFSSSQDRMDEANKLFLAKDYLSARDSYLQVVESDINYEEAQTKAETCLIRYGEDVAAAAEAQMQENNYPGAIETLKAGNETLEGYETFSEAIDSKLPECYERYEAFLLEESANLAAMEDYDTAVNLLVENIGNFPTDMERLRDALDQCMQQSADKHVADAGKRADAYYADGDYESAFAELDEIRAASEDYIAGADRLIAAMEQRFEADLCEEAEECYSKTRENLKDALAILEKAAGVRDLEGFRTYREELEQYLPLSLVEAEYTSKEGTVFRNTGVFEGMDGVKYKDGWIWGTDGSRISFTVDGAYDLFTCTFAVRRDDNVNANGHLEVLCDGEKVLRSETLFHFQTEPQSISLEITGCKVLTLVFVCDYEVSTTENGYCYHGLCTPILTKNIE